MAWLFLILFLVALFLWQLRQSCKIKSRSPDIRIPGPKPELMFGNTKLLNNPDPTTLFKELHDKYGPIYKLQILNEHWVVVNNYAMIRELLVTKGMTFGGKPSGYPVDVLDDLGIIPGMDIGTEAQKLRQLMTKALNKFTHGSSMKDKFTEFQSEALDDFITNLASKNGKPLIVKDDIQRLVCIMTSQLIFGDMGFIQLEKVTNLCDIPHTIMKSKDAVLLRMFPSLRVLNTPSWQTCREMHRLIEDVYSTYEPKLVVPMENVDNYTLMHFLTEKIKPTKGHSDEVKVKGLMASIIIAGIPSTSSFIYRTLQTIACIPRIQRKVHQELDQFVGNRAPLLSDRENCHYIQATIFEVLRNQFDAVLQSARRAMKDTTLGGYDIPAGTVLLANTCVMHHDPEFWDEPYEHKPERFLDAEGRLLPADHPTRKRFMPFNTGVRVCPGESFAKDRIFMTISTLFSRFTIRPGPDQDVSAFEPSRGRPALIVGRTPPAIKLMFTEKT